MSNKHLSEYTEEELHTELSERVVRKHEEYMILLGKDHFSSGYTSKGLYRLVREKLLNAGFKARVRGEGVRNSENGLVFEAMLYNSGWEASILSERDVFRFILTMPDRANECILTSFTYELFSDNLNMYGDAELLPGLLMQLSEYIRKMHLISTQLSEFGSSMEKP